jgi:hypothetical protein
MKIRAQPASFAANRSGGSLRSHFHASTQQPAPYVEDRFPFDPRAR